MLKIDTHNVDVLQIKSLVEVTEKFIVLADELLGNGDITREEYDSMTVLKKSFIEDVKVNYL